MYLIRKLKSFDVDVYILEMVYISFIQSILSFNLVTWYGNLDQKDKNKLNRVVNLANKVIGKLQTPLPEIYDDFVIKKTKSILNEPSHSLFKKFELMPSGRRYRTASWNRVIFKRSFIPTAINKLNSIL